LPKRFLLDCHISAAKAARWQIENQGFNEGKNRYGCKHISHHNENSLLIHWLFLILALVIEHLYRARYLNSGTQMPPAQSRDRTVSRAPGANASPRHDGRIERKTGSQHVAIMSPA